MEGNEFKARFKRRTLELAVERLSNFIQTHVNLFGHGRSATFESGLTRSISRLSLLFDHQSTYNENLLTSIHNSSVS